ncbi:MAG: YcxB family protein [Nannocystaceae bacterium]|nr:YcxB family protein [Nannocystaceae bacterium]
MRPGADQEVVYGHALLEMQDYVGAYVAQARNRATTRKGPDAVGISMLLVAGALLASGSIAPGVWCVTVLVQIVAFVLIRRAPAAAGRRAFNNQPSLRVDLALEPKGIRKTLKRSDRWISWRVFTGWLETKEAFMLYDGTELREVLPKRAFADPALARELIAKRLLPAERRGDPEQGNKKTGLLRTSLIWILLTALCFAVCQLARHG